MLGAVAGGLKVKTMRKLPLLVFLASLPSFYSVIPAEAGIQANHMLSMVSISNYFKFPFVWILACARMTR